MDTIFATASGAPPAAIAIIRLSGPAAKPSAIALAGSLPADRNAGLRVLRDPRDGQILDRAIVLQFGAPRTATGEDIVEFHVHGGRAVVAAVESALRSLPGLRHAEAGEFTRRALLNGVIDLTEAEGLGDLLSAQTEGQRRAALRIAEGSLRILVEDWTTRLVVVAAGIEAQLDFSDEGDVSDIACAAIVADVHVIAREIAAVLSEPPVERLMDGIRVVLGGPPNAGKSTLLNALADRDVAIVSQIPGTTRDRMEASVVRGGVAFVLTDTAGLRIDSEDPIEQIGIARAQAALAAADVVVWLGDDPPERDAIWVHARSDQAARGKMPQHCHVAVSAHDRADVTRLWEIISGRAAELLPSDTGLTTNTRQRALLVECLSDLESISSVTDLIIVAEHVRRALGALDRLVGRSGVEDILDATFARFCIGK